MGRALAAHQARSGVKSSCDLIDHVTGGPGFPVAESSLEPIRGRLVEPSVFSQTTDRHCAAAPERQVKQAARTAPRWRCGSFCKAQETFGFRLHGICLGSRDGLSVWHPAALQLALSLEVCSRCYALYSALRLLLISFLSRRLKPKAAAAPRAGRGPGAGGAVGTAWAHTEMKLPCSYVDTPPPVSGFDKGY